MSTPACLYTLVTFASHWGSRFGGINAFNSDFLAAMGVAFYGKVEVICVVNTCDDAAVTAAKNSNVTLLQLPFEPKDPHMGEAEATAAIGVLKERFDFDSQNTIWLGHDRITGQAALTARAEMGGRSALIHHMSYDHYEAFAENAQTAKTKNNQQKKLFKQADIVMGVGPLLRDALEDMLDSDAVNMLIPGLADIEPKKLLPKTFSMFVSGRLADDAAKVKQGYLAVAAFAQSYKQAQLAEQPEALLKRPKLLMRGVNFDLNDPQDQNVAASEQNLQKFAHSYADSMINLQALPYTTDRTELFDDLKAASVAAMPSWHEGFGLVAWEAIAAGVPLILSKHSGVYDLIVEKHGGFEEGFVEVVNVGGNVEDPYFSETDLTNVCTAINNIAKNPTKARERALRLRSELMVYSWAKCAEDVAGFFSWPIEKGVGEKVVEEVSERIEEKAPELAPELAQEPAPAKMTAAVDIAGFAMPKAFYSSSSAISMLLRASEAVVPFDQLRQPELDKLHQWASDSEFTISLRLITGEGGTGKTRLASQLCNELKLQNWTVGFLDRNRNAAELAKTWQGLQATDKPCLLVVDYAETQSSELINLLKHMLNSGTTQNIRLLLLARDGGDWWSSLPSTVPGTSLEDLLIGRRASGPFVVPALYQQLADRQQGYQNALDAFADVLKLQSPAVVPDLTGEHFSNALYIQMSALLTLYGELPHSADGITKAVLIHEQKYWNAALTSQGFSTAMGLNARKLLALVTLAGHFETYREAQKYWQVVDKSVMPAAEFRRLFECLEQLYPATHGLQAVKPDLLGEALLADMLTKQAGPGLLTAVLNSSSSDVIKSHALTVLARLSLYKPELDSVVIDAMAEHLAGVTQVIVSVAVESQSRLPSFVIAALGQLGVSQQNAVAGLFKSLIMHDSQALNGVSCEVRRLIYQKVKKRFDRKPNDIKVWAEYANHAHDYGLSLYYMGDVKAACAMSQIAVDISAELVKRDASKYEAGYADKSNNYANLLNNLGQNKEAMKYDEEVLVIRKKLAEKSPGHYEASYALSLYNYSSRLAITGQYEAARESSEKALVIYKRFAEQKPDRYEVDYADALKNYSITLSNLGQYQATQELIKKALVIYQRLAEQNPDRYEANYADALASYSNQLIDLGKYALALTNQKAAIAITQRLYQQLPSKHADDLGYQIFGHRLTSWLLGQTSTMKIKLDDTLLQHVLAHEKPRLFLVLRFVEGLEANEHHSRKAAFEQVIADYCQLDSVNQRYAEEVWFCAALWLEQQGLQSPENWLDSWQQNKQRLGGNISQWMLDFADKVGAQWPE